MPHDNTANHAPTITYEATSASRTRAFQFAWGLAMCFYFLEYAARSAPAVMIPHLSLAFGTTAVGVSAILGAYYYTYSLTSLIAGAALDRVGARKAVPIGIFILAVGCLLFSVSSTTAGYAGRLLQGAGSAFAFTGAVYLATHGFSARWLATAIGVTQCLGMLGGAAGQFVVGPLLEHGVAWQTVWHSLGVASLVIGVLLFAITPHETRPQGANSGWASVLAPLLGRISKPAVVSVRSSGRTPVCAHDHRRHDLGSRLLSARQDVQLSRCRGHRFPCSTGMGDWLSPARLARRSDRPSQAGTDRQVRSSCCYRLPASLSAPATRPL